MFPECLHMEQYLALNSGFPPLYHLTAVVEHCGDVSAGHFITYRRGPGNTWLLTSDTLVCIYNIHIFLYILSLFYIPIFCFLGS